MKPDDNIKNINVQLPLDLAVRVKVFCVQSRITMKQFAKNAFENELNRWPLDTFVPLPINEEDK